MAIKLFEIFYKSGKMRSYAQFSLLINKLSSTKKDTKKHSIMNFFKDKKPSLTSRRSNLSIIAPGDIHYIEMSDTFIPKMRTISNFGDKYQANDTTTSKFEQTVNLDFNLIEPHEEIVFETEKLCMECQGVLNLEALSFDFERMRKELLWAVCPYCQNNIIPKLGVKIGDKNPEDVILYSPYYLKTNYIPCLMKEFGTSLKTELFRKKYLNLFWNCFWFFSNMELPYDFILPYKYDLDMYEADEKENYDKTSKIGNLRISTSVSPPRKKKSDNTNSNIIITNDSLLIISPENQNEQIKFKFETEVSFGQLQIDSKVVDIFIEPHRIVSCYNSNKSNEIIFESVFDPMASFVNSGNLALDSGSEKTSLQNQNDNQNENNVRKKYSVHTERVTKRRKELLKQKIGFKSVDLTKLKTYKINKNDDLKEEYYYKIFKLIKFRKCYSDEEKNTNKLKRF